MSAGTREAQSWDALPACFPFLRRQRKCLPGVMQARATEGLAVLENQDEEGRQHTSNLQQLSCSFSVPVHTVLKSFFQRGAFQLYQIETTSKWQNREQIFHSNATWGNETLFTFIKKKKTKNHEVPSTILGLFSSMFLTRKMANAV